MLVLLLMSLLDVGASQEASMVTIQQGELGVVLDPRAGPVERRAADLLREEVQRRSGVTAVVEQARYTLDIGGRAEGLGADGFRLELTPDVQGRMRVGGQSPSGVVAGVGKLLRLMRFHDGSLQIPSVDLADAPVLPIRGIYFASHFFNFYHVAPLEEVDRVIEDFALWGGNQLTVWFDMHHFRDFQDPAAQEHFARLKHFGETAHSLGMQFGLTFIANEAYDSSPVELRADSRTGTAHYERELCPSKPGALELIGKWQAEELDAFRDVDFVWMWPYDQGGCACPECAPWGANGFLKCSEQLAKLYRDRFPEGKRWLSTWLIDQVNAKGEYEGLFRYVREKQPDWFDGYVIGTHGDWIPQPLLERPFPERYPMAAFPEISMYRMGPWGEHGANPLPDFNTRLAEKLRGNILGGWPYSEGIYEDLNKWHWCRFYWNPDGATDEVLAEYAAYYLSPEVAADAVRLFYLMEQTHARNGWRVANLEGADEEWRLAQSIDERLPAWAKQSWRWRILYIRAAIDGILKEGGFDKPEAREELRPLCDELVAIYHADRTFIRPPAFPPAPDPRNVAYGKPVTVSSCGVGYEDRPRHLTDGVLAQHDGENFWCHNPKQEPTATVTIDLGEPVRVADVRLQFRGLHGVFWFIPESLEVQVSTDGAAFATIANTRDVPVEGSPYRPDLKLYPVGGEARYVRLVLGPSQHKGDQFAGVIELTEVEVYRE
jgi:hypothetical protein